MAMAAIISGIASWQRSDKGVEKQQQAAARQHKRKAAWPSAWRAILARLRLRAHINAPLSRVARDATASVAAKQRKPSISMA